ncbi:Uncharacterized protein conserved in bacteria [Mannheimia haemolytica]|uniref:Uncharacterized protein conserved in bacteria n=1 Tax=Mannheimia haemolytica TaxID=75985 RepID=A0A448T9G3_MANHA|nr:DUF2322 family protein [Mannheimia haemolytica]VEI76627.1 Uncharacterized protein conserved in bacteria [Mannheimia haemolytica]
MQFKDYLATFPAIEHLAGLNVVNSGEVIQHIPAIEGKLGSLKLYNALFSKFDGKLTASAAKQGLEWFAEHVEDAKNNVGKHPNIDLLFRVIEQDLSLSLEPIVK